MLKFYMRWMGIARVLVKGVRIKPSNAALWGQWAWPSPLVTEHDRGPVRAQLAGRNGYCLGDRLYLPPHHLLGVAFCPVATP